MAYTWAERAGRYRDERTGRFVSERTVRSVVDKVADATSARLDASARGVLDGSKSIATFQADLMREIKVSNVAAAVIARGGAEQMRPQDWGRVGQIIRQEYNYAKSFAADLASGKQPFNGTVASRAAMYGQRARVTFEQVRGQQQQEVGYQYERNIINSGESCAGCRAQSARGLVPIGSLVPVGRRNCLSRCRCTIAYQRAAQEIAA